MSNPDFFVGIDFGTSRSGYAYSVINEDGIKLRTHWPCEEGAAFPKTLTCLLYSKQPYGLQVEAWGWEAFRKYTSMGKNDKPDYIYIDRNIKLSLADNPTPLPQGLAPVRVISDYLTCLLKDVDTTLTANYGAQYSRDKVQWCMTVPAGWSQDAKLKMQEAAILAGMVPAEDTARLSMIHEPEAACLGILNVPGADIKVLDGQIVMVIDAGGGTVDITVHKAVKQGTTLSLKEVTYREMLTEGATFIDQRFDGFVRELLGDKYRTWCDASPKDRITFLHRTFEHIKRQHVLSSHIEYELEFPTSLTRLIASDTKLVEKLERLQDGEGDRLKLTAAKMDEFFDASITRIIETSIRAIDRAGQKPDHLFIVGGFADSKYLVGKIRQALSAHVETITCPQCSGSAIMQGAVMHGRIPTAILTRRSPQTYGIRICKPWVEGTSPTGSRVVYDGLEYTNKGFHKFVERDEELPVDHEVFNTHVPITATQDNVRLDIFETENHTPVFTTETGMKLLGGITVTGLQAAGLGSKLLADLYKIKVCMKFGTTIIGVTAADQQSGKNFDTQVAFGA